MLWPVFASLCWLVVGVVLFRGLLFGLLFGVLAAFAGLLAITCWRGRFPETPGRAALVGLLTSTISLALMAAPSLPSLITGEGGEATWYAAAAASFLIVPFAVVNVIAALLWNPVRRRLGR